MARRHRIASALLLACAAGACAWAQPQSVPDDWPQALDAQQLDGQRGGFTLGGLAISIGVERLVSINGIVVARTNLALADTAALSPMQAQAMGAALGSQLVQNGDGNRFLATLGDGSFGGAVIQNSLNDQTIRNQTVINASVNSVSMLKTLNFNDSVGQAIANALGQH